MVCVVGHHGAGVLPGLRHAIVRSVPEWLGWVGVSVTVHDNPEAIPPERHFGFESKLAWLHIHDDLPHTEYPDKFLESVGVDDNDAYGTLTKVGR